MFLMATSKAFADGGRWCCFVGRRVVGDSWLFGGDLCGRCRMPDGHPFSACRMRTHVKRAAIALGVGGQFFLAAPVLDDDSVFYWHTGQASKQVVQNWC